MTTVIQIGNSDNKLTQEQWSHFYVSVNNAIMQKAKKVHFTGHSYGGAIWQNAAWIFEIDEETSLHLWDDMKVLCRSYNQDSIAWTEGETIFVVV